MQLDILFFGLIAEKTQQQQDLLILDHEMTLAQIRTLLEQKFENLQHCVYTFAVDEELISDETFSINKSVCLALLPAFAGG